MAIDGRTRREFEARGWLHLGPVFSSEEIDAIRAEYDRILARPLRLGEQGKTPFEYAALLHVQSPPWHQDNGYTPVVPERYLTFTLAIDATTEENGCLWIQPGSHLRGVQPHQPTDMVFFRGYEGGEPGVAVPQLEGDVLVFSSLTMHRTGPNRSGGPRRSWVIQFCDAETRHGATGQRLDDRLLVARDGVPLDAPYRDRPLDLGPLVEAARAAGIGRS